MIAIGNSLNKNIVLHAFTTSKRSVTSLSLSPCHLDTKLDVETLKNVYPTCEATALAIRVFPVPGGP